MNLQKNMLDLLGVTAFHKAGYKGQGIKIISNEKVYSKDFPDCISPDGFETNDSKWHGNEVMRYINLIAPDATKYAYPVGGTFRDDIYTSPTLQYIIDNNIDVFTSSNIGGLMGDAQKNAYQKCIDNGTMFFFAAGNKGEEGLLGESKSEKVFAIGGIKYLSGKTVKDMKVTSYSSIGKELDYVTLAEIPIDPKLDTGARGTSFCSPVFAGMCALVQNFFLVNVGRKLTYKKLLQFVDDNCVDLYDKGVDDYTGKGIFILPNPKSIDIKKYAGTEIILTIDSNKVLVDGKEKEVSYSAFLKDNRTFVPIRVLEELGFNVKWLETTRQVKLTSIN